MEKRVESFFYQTEEREMSSIQRQRRHRQNKRVTMAKPGKRELATFVPEHGPRRGTFSWQVEGRMDSGGEKVDAGNSFGTLEILG